VKCIEDEIPFELPEGWEWSRANCISDVRDGTHDTPAYVEKGVPLITSKNLTPAGVDYSNVKYISVEDATQINQRSGVDVGDILFAMIGTIGNPKLVTENTLISIKNVALFKFSYSSDLSHHYILRVLEYLQEQMKENPSGGLQPFVSLNRLRTTLLPIAPITEQNRIVEKLENLLRKVDLINYDCDELDTLIKAVKSKILDLAIRGQLVPQDPNDEPASVLLERIRAEKEELIKAGKIKRDKKESIIFRGEDNSYYEKFSDGKCHCIDDELPFELPDGWEWCNLSMIGTTNIGLTYRPADIEPDGTIVLRSSNIVNDEIDLNDLVRVKTKIRENQYVQPNDILICARNGSKALVGKCALVNNLKEPTSFGAFMAIYRTNYNKYVMHYLRTSLFRSVFNDGNSTAINQLTQDMLKRALIPFPPILEQEKIVNVVSKLFIHLHGIEKSLN